MRRERFLPFPGWTLPNVFGAGGLQALVKGGLKIESKRVVVAGTGPLLLAVADYLNSKGAKVLLIAEQTSAAKLRRFARGLWRQPAKMVEAAALRARLVGIPYKTDCWVTSADVSSSSQTLRSVKVFRNGITRTVECDYLACGFHLVPNLELASLLGAKDRKWFCRRSMNFSSIVRERIFLRASPRVSPASSRRSSRVRSQALLGRAKLERRSRILQHVTKHGDLVKP